MAAITRSMSTASRRAAQSKRSRSVPGSYASARNRVTDLPDNRVTVECPVTVRHIPAHYQQVRGLTSASPPGTLSGMNDGMLRAGDHDRAVTAEYLRAAVSAGRLDLAEYDDRLRRVYVAETYADLRALVTDLPDEISAAPTSALAWMRRKPHLVRDTAIAGFAVCAIATACQSAGPFAYEVSWWLLVPTAVAALGYRHGRRPRRQSRAAGSDAATGDGGIDLAARQRSEPGARDHTGELGLRVPQQHDSAHRDDERQPAGGHDCRPAVSVVRLVKPMDRAEKHETK